MNNTFEYWVYIIVLVIIILVIYYYYKWFNSRFASYSEFKRVVNRCSYFDCLTQSDLIARNSNMANYRAKYLSAVAPFTYSEKLRLYKCSKIIQEKLPSSILNFCSKLQWKLVKFKKNVDVELGNPHTIDRFIILTDDIFQLNNILLAEIFMHELLHIYQRYNERSTDKLISKLGFIKTKYYNETDLLKLGIRVNLASNPDVKLVDYLYQDKLLKFIYNDGFTNLSTRSDDYAKGATEISIDLNTGEVYTIDFLTGLTQQCHPNEVMAELVTRYCFGKKSQIRTDWLLIIEKWIREL